MSDRTPENHGHDGLFAGDTVVEQAIAKGTALGGAVLLVTVGLLEALQGLSAVDGDKVLDLDADYRFQLGETGWGWIHVVLGIVVAAAGAALFTGRAWARVAAMVICGVSILVNFLWLPNYPMWAISIIALNAVVIWAVATWNPEETSRP
ncbi:hypothetical protein MPC38_08625 [Prescottella equi]|uniref:DUF7144 family membrane protein n=1 Tax=Rhodococcus hoagii TaxID=43767 RepID=UPI001F5BA777|nr:hypothetical protein [Prescottella equi]UNQ41290.1 hypothetical protein MPC38_08625 [Prescottella equi]